MSVSGVSPWQQEIEDSPLALVSTSEGGSPDEGFEPFMPLESCSLGFSGRIVAMDDWKKKWAHARRATTALSFRNGSSVPGAGQSLLSGLMRRAMKPPST